jgi:hypothetical protein
MFRVLREFSLLCESIWPVFTLLVVSSLLTTISSRREAGDPFLLSKA